MYKAVITIVSRDILGKTVAISSVLVVFDSKTQAEIARDLTLDANNGFLRLYKVEQ